MVIFHRRAINFLKEQLFTQATSAKWNGLQLNGRRSDEAGVPESPQHRRREQKTGEVHSLPTQHIARPRLLANLVSHWSRRNDANGLAYRVGCDQST